MVPLTCGVKGGKLAGRKKRLPNDAKALTICLGGEERLALQVIEIRRQRRLEGRDSPSEIVSDVVWYYLENVEKMSRAEISVLLPPTPNDQNQSNLKTFPTKTA
jgi:hypothetical protein